MDENNVNQELFAIVRGLLVAPRTLTAKTATEIINFLEVDDAVGGLASGRLAEFEEYEVEILLSPLFTPTTADRAACEAALSPAGISSRDLQALEEQLSRDELCCQVVYGLDVATMLVPDIVIERFVKLLGLTNPLPESIVTLLENAVDDENRNLAFSLARRPVWVSGQNCGVLAVCLEKMVQKGSFSADKMDFLTAFVRTYRPKEPALLLTNLINMVEAYNRDKEHPVYNRNLAKKQEKSLMPLSCNREVRAMRISMANALLADFEQTATC